MEIYDAPNNQWNDAAEISQKRVFTSAVLIGPCIYVMGGHAGILIGYDFSISRNSVHCYEYHGKVRIIKMCVFIYV